MTIPSRFPLGRSRAAGTTRRVPSGGSHGSIPGFAATSSTHPTPTPGARSISVSSAFASRNDSLPTGSADGGGASSGCGGGAGGACAQAAATSAAQTATSPLRADLDRRAVIHELPDLVHLVIGHRDAAVGPVELPLCLADPALAVGQAVDHHAVPRRHPGAPGEVEILLVGIGDAQRAVEAALLDARL